MTIGVPIVTGLYQDVQYQQCTNRQKQSKTVKTAEMTIGVPMYATGVPSSKTVPTM